MLGKVLLRGIFPIRATEAVAAKGSFSDAREEWEPKNIGKFPVRLSLACFRESIGKQSSKVPE